MRQPQAGDRPRRRAGPQLKERPRGDDAPVDIGGVPGYIVDRGGPLVLGLTFRVGHADEELSTRGTTHLIEHLALHEASVAGDLTVNGQVEATQTTFLVRGGADEVVRFVDSVCGSLRRLPLHRLEAEARVLRVEGNSRQPSAYGALLANRFGASGYGLVAYPELGLHNPDAAVVQAWANKWFTRANAVIWATGPTPTLLEVDLPEGRRVPPPAPVPLPWTFPAWYVERASVVALSFVIPRDDAATLCCRLLDRRLHERLRMGQGQSYETGTYMDSWTTEQVHGMAFADTLPDHAGDVRDGLVAELGRLATIAPTVAELEVAIALFDKWWSAQEASAGIAASQASNGLIGHRVRSVGEALREMRSVTPNEVSSAARRMLDGALLQVPAGSGVPDRRFTPVPEGSLHVPAGTTYVRSSRLHDATGDHTLVVGAEGVCYVQSTDQRVAITASEVVAVQRWTDDARTIWGRDGLRVFVHPDEWKNGNAAIAAIDAWRLPRRAVDMGDAAGSAYLDEVERTIPAKPKRGVLGRRRPG